MNTASLRDSRFALFSAFLDGRCSAAAERDVLSLLEKDADARRDFTELSQMHYWLSEDADTRRVLSRADCAPDNIIPLPGLPAPAANPPAQPTLLRNLRPLAAAVAAAVAALALLPAGAWMLQRQFIDPIVPGRAPGQTSLAWWSSPLTPRPAESRHEPAPGGTREPVTMLSAADQCVHCHAPDSPVLVGLH